MSAQTQAVDLVGDETVENLARAAVFAALTGAFAYVAFPNPISPTSITLQVLGVFLAGIYLGPVWGGASLSLYLVAGAAGAPVFLGGSSGIGALLGNTGGFLWACPVAAAVVGAVVHGTNDLRDPSEVHPARLVVGMTLATAVIYAMGTVGAAVVQNLGLYRAFMLYAVPFIPAEAIKMAAAVGIARTDELNAA
ncbi:biotin transporter BioY [Halobacterium zhouii]|uniref:biotin transporter BioY n=1 Tax=Halobacterium zhouii TaxID=2902624 RepID=UPI001E3FB93D|nr:biotin transporter BioY [Halobacterium zhouii]